MSAKDNQDPSTTSLAYDIMAPRWLVIETLLGGTEAMREAGQGLTPKHEEETQANYDARLAATVLVNMTEETLTSLSGKPFSEDIKINEDVPEPIQGKKDDPKSGLMYNIDLQGNNLHVFAQAWFREGLAKAFCDVLVEMPRPAKEPAPGEPRTLEDDRNEGRRPYWVLIKPENVLFVEAEVVDGKEVLKHVRIAEVVTERDGFAEIQRRRIRVMEPGTVSIWEPHPTRKKNGKPVWMEVDSWETGLNYIPMVTYYARREDFRLAKPPLLDLAWLNVTHWNSTSDQRNILRVARFPLLACSGATAEDSDPVVVGPNKILYNQDPQGKFYYVEHTGAAIEQGRKDLESLEEQMAMYGHQFLRQKPGNETATGRAIDSADNNTDLAAMAALFEDAVAQALDLTAEMLRITGGGGSVEVVKNFNQAEEDAKAMEALDKARDRKDISRKTHLEAMRQRGYLPEDFDAELDAEDLLEEQDVALARAGFDLDPLGRPQSPPEIDPETGKPIQPNASPTQPPSGKPPAKKAAKKVAVKK